MLRAMRTRQIVAALATCVLAACHTAARTPKTNTKKALDVDAEKKHLVLPPGDDALPSVNRLAAAARSGDERAAWAETHYLLDLFDAARYAGDDASRKVLFAALEIPDGHGDEVTNRVIDAILTIDDRVLTADRLHGGAQAARTLLEQDRTPPKGRDELFARMSQLKGIARGTGPLVANAELRLAGFCARAIQDAVGSPPAVRPRILAYCLYPLYDSDPEPYFADDPSQRPPDPRWEDLIVDLVKLLKQVEKSKSRLAALGPASAASEVASLDANKDKLPTLPDPAALGVPSAAHADPYTWTPLVTLGDGAKVAAPAELVKKIAPRIAQDGRARIAVALTAAAPASAAVTVAQAGALGGARAIELVVSYDQQLKVPAGDYWAGRAKDDKVTRLGVVGLAISVGDKPIERDDTRGGGWDPARATLALHLIMNDKTWTLVGAAGALDPVKAGDVAALTAQLAMVLGAYESEDGLILVPQAGATYADLVNVATAARGDSTHRLFASIALGDTAPPAPKKGAVGLAAKLARRASAKVTISPDTLASRVAAARACYQDRLEQNPKLAGAVTMSLKGDAVTITDGPRDPELRKCLLDRLSDSIKDGKIANTRIELSAK
jgi:hypothetical protein